MGTYELISKWRALFNPDPHKPVHEVLFSQKKKVLIHPVIRLYIYAEKVSYQKHLDEKITFIHQIHNALCKVNKGVVIK